MKKYTLTEHTSLYREIISVVLACSNLMVFSVSKRENAISAELKRILNKLNPFLEAVNQRKDDNNEGWIIDYYYKFNPNNLESGIIDEMFYDAGSLYGWDILNDHLEIILYKDNNRVFLLNPKEHKNILWLNECNSNDFIHQMLIRDLSKYGLEISEIN